MNGLLQDVVYGLRMLRKNLGVTALAVVTLALGIGANTAIFSNVNALVLRPFAFPDLDRVTVVYETVPKQDATSVKAAPANFHDWIEQNKTFDHLAAIHGWDANLTGEGVAERVEGYQVTSDFFSLLGIAPQLGRQIGTADFEHGTAPVVVLSNGFWTRHLAGDPKVVGRSLLLNGKKFEVIGVASQDLDFPVGAEIWTPLDLGSATGTDRENHYLQVIGRVKSSSSISRAQADLQAIADRLGQQLPNTNGGHGIRVAGLVQDLTFGTRQFVLVLMGAAVFVLLLACVNVANLQFARISGRQKEMAVRIGLGASRSQLIRQLLVESALLALAGAGAGVLLAGWGMKILLASLPPFIVAHAPGLRHVEIDSRVLWFTLAIALLSGLLAGLAPALRFSSSELGDILKENTRSVSSSSGAGRLRSLLVVSQVALALVLLVGAGLMVTGFHNLLTVEMGFDPTRVLTFHIALPGEKYQNDDQLRAYYERVIQEVRSLPGVESAACVTSLPAGWSWNWTEYTAEGRPPTSASERPSAISQIVTPDFFGTLRVPLLQGRLLTAADKQGALPVVVISERMARDNWPGQNPLGKHLKLGRADGNEPQRTVVGVMGDVRASEFDDTPAPATYVPFAQLPQASTAIVVRTSTDPSALASAVLARVRSIDSDEPPYDVRTMEQVISDNLSGVESSARMMMIFGFTALVLAAAGIFAVMSYSVTQRTHEIGVRMALGARRFDVLRLVVGKAVSLAAIGLAIGVSMGLLLAHALSSLLFGVIRIDAAVFVLLTIILAAVAALAAYIPARWAMKVDPMQALRYE
ncbi:MAG TPA: ABC transporter permease [Terriglobales bacterium]|jgi:putative ABC transport system permease protein|nr:ABC transporter permease [Terriglobales bacterium]